MDFQNQPIVVIGGGLAGLSATLRLAENGYSVILISLTQVKRSHSVCAQGGINAALEERGEGDSPLVHAYETIKGGDFLANQAPILEMCLAAPRIIQMMARFGCPFNRTKEGHLDVRRFGGTLFSRTVFCGASTGQQLLYTLDEQVRKFEALGKVIKKEHHEFLRLLFNENQEVKGILLQDLFNLSIEAITGQAVVIATGGLGTIFKKSTNSTFCTGAANGRLYRQGMIYANGEFIQIHPTAIPGIDKLRLMSESARGEGGRLWVPGDSTKTILNSKKESIPCGKTGEPWYFLEDLYPAYGNLIPRDIASREVLRICEMGLGINQGMEVYLDISHLSEEKKHKLEAILHTYKKFTGDDPKKVPMKIFPAVHYSMGGAWVDYPASSDTTPSRFRQMTNLKGCFAIGEADFQYHGANRLGANSLLSCIFSGLVAGDEVPRYLSTVTPSPLSASLIEKALEEEEKIKHYFFSLKGPENPFLLHQELSDIMIKEATVKKTNKGLSAALEKIYELKERLKNIHLNDASPFLNQTYIFAKQLLPMLDLSEIIVKGSLLRNESRGSHYKEEFPERNDKEFLKTTLATFNPSTEKCDISYEAIDLRYATPELRDYSEAHVGPPPLKNIPDSLPLPL